jgi:hypothetical protein
MWRQPANEQSNFIDLKCDAELDEWNDVDFILESHRKPLSTQQTEQTSRHKADKEQWPLTAKQPL